MSRRNPRLGSTLDEFLESDGAYVDASAKAVKKVLQKGNGLEMLSLVREELAQLETYTEEAIEALLRRLAEEKEVGLGKVAQPLRVAICGNTVSPPIFDAVELLGRDNVLARIDQTLSKFGAEV